MMSVNLSGDGGRLEILIPSPQGRVSDETGFVWLPCHCSCHIGPFTASFPFQMTDRDVQRMRARLISLTQRSVEEIALGNLEEDIALKFVTAKTGSVTIEGRLNPRIADNVALEFRIESDLATIDRALKALNPS
jgi:hypothetical protein